MKPLAIIPTYLRSAKDAEMLRTTLVTLRETAGDRCDVLVVDDGSPADDLAVALRRACEECAADLILKEENQGFSTTVNMGLRRCLDEGRDAVLVNADIEFGAAQDWLELMQGQLTRDGSMPAAVVGGLLTYPNGLIQHAGIYFSLLTRDFRHRFHFGPGNLPEAQLSTICPVTGALQLIRHECLEHVGLYDESFKLGWEDVDYCLRTMLSGRECIYAPRVRAVHHESAFRGRSDPRIAKWTEQSWLRFVGKYADQSFIAFVPTMLDELCPGGRLS